MPTFNTLRLDPPQDAAEFEKIVNAAADIKWKGTYFQRYGRPGQQQDGVDIYGCSGPDEGMAIQCKNTCHSLPFHVVLSELEKAEKFRHPIKVLFVATTQYNDKSLQDKMWELSTGRRENGLHSVLPLFWEDIVRELAKDRSVLFSFYPHLAWASNDDMLLDEVRRVLPYKGSIEFVKEYRFCRATFDDRNLDDIYAFWELCDDPSFAFQDARLENLRLTLIQNIRNFTGLIGAHYTRLVGRELLAFHDYADQAYVDEIRTKMEMVADALVSTYQALLSPRRASNLPF
ncbi:MULTISPECIES: hypothetical protein [Burkholderia]|uniref:Restriction endonuclease type IV Mrr domain-containing protein n=3 Tax=Burkholderia contaminans TaxID=488447 RepID=A0A250LHB8_9BURK|nr:MULTISPECIES: hypothetical protein [Burkholderia]UTP27228.1 hypothetical protein NMB33_33855 [Burkholderia sp. FXe9]MBH9693937.1 hypothetical protein [Burkholderia contaminans]MBK1905807.1 hypothetical protein [Burkholderia contaminans]MBK1914048.1 hypothetical protein [Burkholderia contaminans]MBK1927934.1 hypothetical protein [Burkholderia contaminans]